MNVILLIFVLARLQFLKVRSVGDTSVEVEAYCKVFGCVAKQKPRLSKSRPGYSRMCCKVFGCVAFS